MSPLEEGLLSKLNQVAKTLKEKMIVLEARDKYIRLHREKQTNIETAKATLGTCQDMCPEYERYFREDTNQISLLEMNKNNQPDPYAMVKEYRRAGADQEEPLSHDLRSPETLQITCDYLVCNILDRVEEDPSITSEWYDFVWSRTRAIRKDITQQHLCDKTAVSILEKCARFHIHCAEALCEEDLSIFDPKINNENLNKCIQSLKDFYTDLYLKNIACENEPEFLGYYLLLNLKHNDILREAKYFHKKVRDSEPVKFAINCYFAMTSNNFVRFFNLVRNASYLNACILHRYFYKVRVQAFKILRKSHTIPNQTEAYPAYELIKQLGFKDENELNIFCQSIELSVDRDCVILKRGRTLDNYNESNLVRSPNLIEIKRQNIRLSEIINGQELPVNPYGKHQLHESFDHNGMLKKESLEIFPLHDTTPAIEYSSTHQNYHHHQPHPHPHPHLYPQSQFQPQPQPNQPYPSEDLAKKESDLYSEEIRTTLIFQIAESIFNEVIQSMVIDAIEKLVVQKCIALFKETYIEAINESIRDCCEKVYLEEKEIFENNKKFQMALNHIAQNICDTLICETIYQIVQSTVTSIYNQEINTFVITQSAFIAELLISEVIQEVIFSIASQYYQQILDTQNQLIHSMRAKRSKRLAKNYFNLWWRRCLKVRRYNQIKSTFPASSIENVSGSIHSISFKRRLSNSETINCVQSNHELKITKKIDQSKENQEFLKPKLFADAVANVSEKESLITRVNSNSKLEKLKLKLEQEKKRTKFFRKSLETFKYSLSFSKKSDDEDEDNLAVISIV